MLITPKGKSILIDGGGEELGSFNVGEKTLLPYLLNRKVSSIDYAIISHYDSDHCQAFLYVLQKIRVKQIIIGKQFEESKNYKKFIEIIKNKKTKIKVMQKNEKINIEKNIYFDVIWPDEKNVIGENNLNNNSLVLKLNYKNFSILFTGDIEKEAEQKILESINNKILKSTVIKIAHHGSKTSSTQEFIQKVNPQIALIGVGEKNKFGHPSDKTIQLLKSINCKIYRTDEMGEITLKINSKGKIEIKTKL